MKKTSDIIFNVNLDENNIPEKIEWQATDGGTEGAQERSLDKRYDGR
jgi:hypothetical protein